MKSSFILFGFSLFILVSCDFDYVPERKSEREKEMQRQESVESVPYARENEESFPESVETVTEEEAEFPGGQQAMAQWLQMNVSYPEKELDQGIGGRVYVRFIVDTKGNIKNVTVSRGASPGLDKEAVRAVRSMPRWKPGKNNGKPVNMWYNLPIKFTPE